MKDNVPTAIVYDYDGTLARGNIQENSFLPSAGITKEEFWSNVKQKTKENDADEILIYMKLMLERANNEGIKVTKDALRRHGGTSTLFNGLENGSWFERTNNFASDLGLTLEHHIVSSGTQEMIEGSPIANYFKSIFASRFLYDDEGVAVWPSLAINYTTKTQFLFRINKGVQNVWDNKAVNSYMAEVDRPIPFKRMIFIGDGDTDIPSMKMTVHQGGHSIAAYDPKRDARTMEKIHSLISDDRANFVAPADYSENSQMEIIIKGILERIAKGVV